MNPDAKPFTPASVSSIPSSTDLASQRQKSVRERRRRFNIHRAKSESQADESYTYNSSLRAKDPANGLDDTTSKKQHKLKTDDAKKQRRRQRNKTKYIDKISGHEADVKPTTSCNTKKTSQKAEHNQSKFDIAAGKHTARRQRQRVNKSKRHVDKNPTTTASRDEFDLDQCFPSLAPSTLNSNVDTISNSKSFWNECLSTKPILPVPGEKSEHGEVEEMQSTLYNEFGVPLTMLTSKPRLDVANHSVINFDGFEQQQQESSPPKYVAKPTPLLSNLKTKWNDSQMSRIRERLWEAERAKRRMDIERRKKEKEQLLLEEESDDDTSSVSQCSSSSSSIDFHDECDVGMKQSSLTAPFDERRIKQTSTSTMIRHHHVSQQGASLEKECLQSSHPFHSIIRRYYLLKLELQQQQVGGYILQGTTCLDADKVMVRLLERQDTGDTGQWESTTANMYDVLLGEVDPPIRKDVKLLSADPAALNPLQLAIVLDLPHVIRILLSSRRQISMEGEFGHTPLMLACELNRLECIEALLSLITKPKLDHREKVGGNSAFHFCCMNAINMNTSDNAIRSNAVDALELLLSKTPFQLQKRALFSVNNKRQSLLHLACVSGDLRLVDCLLNELNSRGSSFVTKALNMRDAYHRVPFISAVKADERDVAVHLIVSRFANRTDFGTWFESCPLTIACSNGSIDMIRMLLELGYHTSYDINRALLEAIKCKSNTLDEDEHDEACRSEIISLIVNAGANPHSTVAKFPDKHMIHGLRDNKSVKEKARKGDTPLAVAARCEDVAAVRTMLNSFSLFLPSFRSSRRCDPLLRKQPETYFQTLESREDDAIDSSLQSALVTSLFQFTKNQSTASAKVALIIYRRGVILSHRSMQWLSNCFLLDKMCPPPLVCPEKRIFALTSDDDAGADGAVTTDWSKVYLSFNATSYKRVRCSHLEEMTNDKIVSVINHYLKEDEFYINVSDQKLIAHKSIVSRKSGKLAAAIRFNESQLANDSDSLSIRLDLPLAVAKMLLAHIYHGSIIFGLNAAADLQCQQLLELALLAEEYLCPSLIMECEMRLLAYGSRECVCRNCLAERNLRCEGGDNRCYNRDETMKRHLYNIPGGCSSLITPQTALDVLAVSQQLEESAGFHEGFYETRCLNSGEIQRAQSPGQIVTTPFVAAKIESISTILRNFKGVITADSFLRQTDDEKEHMSSSPSDPLVMNDKDESAIMLLLLCLDELKHNPLLQKRELLSDIGVDTKN